jgi:hypothetical protein
VTEREEVLKGFIAFVLIAALIIGFAIWYDHEHPIHYEYETVRAKVTNKHTGSRLIGKVIQTTYEIDIQYKDYSANIDSNQLYNLIEVGDTINATLVTTTDKNNKVESIHLEFK